MAKSSICSRCHTIQPYNEIRIPIKYGFNDKQHVLIDGIEHVCSVCGWHVNDIETTQINKKLAEEALQAGRLYKESQSDTVYASDAVKETDEAEEITENTETGEKLIA